jgi:hypothetical protein
VRIAESAKLFVRGPVWAVAGAVSAFATVIGLTEWIDGANLWMWLFLAALSLVVASFYSFHRNQMSAKAEELGPQGLTLEDRAFIGRLSRHYQLGLERLEGIEGTRHQRHLPGLGGKGFEIEATADAKRQEEWWTAEARELLGDSPQLSEHFDNPSRLRDGPPLGLGTELDRVASLFRWRVERLGEVIGWLEGSSAKATAL